MASGRETLRPSVLVGLGKYGLFTAKKVMDAMTVRHPDFATVLRAVGLDESGKLWRLGGNDAVLFTIPGVRPSLFPGVWHDNLARVELEKVELTRALEEELVAISDTTRILELRERGFQVEDGVDLFIFASLFEPVGSVAIVPVLSIIGDIDAYKLSGTFVNISAFFFFPDLFREFEREDLAYARSFATIQEIDALLDKPTAAPIPVEYIWVFSSRNEENRFVANYNDVVSVITESIHLFTTRSIVADTSFSAVLLRKVKSKTSRYSALGSSTFTFPLREVMARLELDVIAEAGQSLHLERDDRWDAAEVAMEVRAFLGRVGADDLDRAFQMDENGAVLWEPFAWRPPTGEPLTVRAQTALDDLNAQVDNFRRDRLLRAQGGVVGRKRALLKAAEEAFGRELDERLNASPESPRRTLAFLDELLDWDTPALVGESDPDSINLGKLLERTRDRMRGMMARARGAAEDEGSASEAGDATEARDTEEALDDADPARRRARMESFLRHMEAVQQDASQALREVDERLHQAEDEADRAQARRNAFVGRYLVGLPLAIAVVLGGALLGMVAADPALKTKWFFLIEVWVGALLLYGGVVWGKLWKDVAEAFRRTQAAAAGARADKAAALKRLEAAATAPLGMRFDRDLLEAQRGFLEDFIQHVARARRHLNDYLHQLAAFVRETEEERRRILLPSTPFTRSAITWEEVDRFVSRHPRFHLESRAFFKEHPHAGYYHAFAQTLALATLRADFQQAADRMFSYLKDMSLEEVLVEMGLLPEGTAVPRLKGCFDQAKAFIAVDAEDVMDESATLVFVLMARSPYGYIEDILNAHSITEPSFYYSGDRHSLVVYRLKAGFPAFLMSSVRFCRAALNRLPDRPMYFVDPLGRLPSIYPTSYTVGDVDDEVRQIVCLGQAFGFLQEYNGGWWLNGQKLADSYDDLGEFLRRMAAGPVRENLKRMVMLCKHEAGAVAKLSSYLRERRVEHIDQHIIAETIRELSPLE